MDYGLVPEEHIFAAQIAWAVAFTYRPELLIDLRGASCANPRLPRFLGLKGRTPKEVKSCLQAATARWPEGMTNNPLDFELKTIVIEVAFSDNATPRVFVLLLKGSDKVNYNSVKKAIKRQLYSRSNLFNGKKNVTVTVKSLDQNEMERMGRPMGTIDALDMWVAGAPTMVDMKLLYPYIPLVTTNTGDLTGHHFFPPLLAFASQNTVAGAISKPSEEPVDEQLLRESFCEELILSPEATSEDLIAPKTLIVPRNDLILPGLGHMESSSLPRIRKVAGMIIATISAASGNRLLMPEKAVWPDGAERRSLVLEEIERVVDEVVSGALSGHIAGDVAIQVPNVGPAYPTVDELHSAALIEQLQAAGVDGVAAACPGLHQGMLPADLRSPRGRGTTRPPGRDSTESGRLVRAFYTGSTGR